MVRRSKKIISLIIIGTLLGPGSIDALAATQASNKEEVIYVNLDKNGNLEETYAVNIFSDKEITDYGDYSSLYNMNTKDEIQYSNDSITINNSSGKLYYEGVLKNAELPWNISIIYKLDGVEYSAEDIAGKSGKLSMELDIKKNANAKDGFFNNYALQVEVKLDTNLCENIVSSDATEANVGNLKQLTYTIMPGKNKKISIEADVNNFEMESIAINGIKPNLGISSDSIDTSKLTEKITDLQNAVSDLDSGANNLNSGAEDLNNGANRLNDGMKTINDALNTLDSKSSNLTTGSSEVSQALSTIQSSLNNVNITTDELTKLTATSTQIKEGIDNLVKGLKTVYGSMDTYYSNLADAGVSDINDFIKNHNEAISALGITNTQRTLYSSYLSGGEAAVQAKLTELVQSGDVEATVLYTQVVSGNADAITNYITSTGKLISIENLLKADISYIQGSNQLISGINGTLDKDTGDLMKGALTLQTSYAQFNASITQLISSLENLSINMTALKNGIDTLASNYDKLDGGIGEYTQAVNSIVDGYNQVYIGAVQMVKGTQDLYNGTKSLTEGTGEFVSETSGMQSEIDNDIDSMLDEYMGSGFEVKSFISDKNTNVKSVQFVIKVAAIKKAKDSEVTEVKEEKLNIWQKFLKLFGIDSL